MVTYAVASGALDPAVCKVLCGEMTAAARRVDATEISDQVFDMTGLYINPEASLLTPAIVTVRVAAGLVLSAVESQDRLDGPGNRTLTGEDSKDFWLIYINFDGIFLGFRLKP